MKLIDFVREFLSPYTYFMLHVDGDLFYKEVFYNAKDYTEHTHCTWNYTVINVDTGYTDSLYYSLIITVKAPIGFYALE